MMAEIARQFRKTSVPLHDVAAKIGLSLSYMEYISADLRRARLIKSLRGPRGGYKLEKPAAEIFITEIVVATRDRPGKSEEGDRHSTNREVRALRDELEGFQYLLLQHISLADVIKGDLKSHPFLKEIHEKVTDSASLLLHRTNEFV